MDEIKIKARRFSYLLPIPFLLLLMTVVYWAVFGRAEDLPLAFQVMAILVCVAGGFLLVHFIRQYWTHPLILHLNDKGFEFNGAGVSMGFIAWEAVEKVEEVEVLATNASIIGARERALGIWLKDPETYYQAWNLVMRKLMKANQEMYGATLLLPISSFGKEYQRVKQVFQEKCQPASWSR